MYSLNFYMCIHLRNCHSDQGIGHCQGPRKLYCTSPPYYTHAHMPVAGGFYHHRSALTVLELHIVCAHCIWLLSLWLLSLSLVSETFAYIVSCTCNLFFHCCIVFLCKNRPQLKTRVYELKSFPVYANSSELNDLIKGGMGMLTPERVEGEESLSGSVFAQCSAWPVHLNWNHCLWRSLLLFCR